MRHVILASLIGFLFAAFPQSPYGHAHDVAVLLPNPTLTPGVIRPDATATQLCAKGFTTKEYRHTTATMKTKVYLEYGVIKNHGICKGGCEIDHLIPLEVGGEDDIKNLWPQPSQPAPGFHEKDKLENYLHAQVCARKITLADAQKMIRTDWYKAFLQAGLN